MLSTSRGVGRRNALVISWTIAGDGTTVYSALLTEENSVDFVHDNVGVSLAFVGVRTARFLSSGHAKEAVQGAPVARAPRPLSSNGDSSFDITRLHRDLRQLVRL